MKKIIFTENAPKAIGPYSQAVFSNDTLYCSGQIALDKNGTLNNQNINVDQSSILLFEPNKNKKVSPL